MPNLDTVYQVSSNGWHQLQRGSTLLPRGTIGFLMLLNGEMSLAQVARELKDVPEPALRALALALEQKGFIHSVKITDSARATALDAIDLFADSPFAAGTAIVQDNPDDAVKLELEAQCFLAMLKARGYAVRNARRADDTATPAPGKGYSALFVDDAPELAGIVGKFLELEGFVARRATNRHELVAELGSAPPPDVILLDVGLPDVDGFDILRRVRRQPALMHIPVIMVTGKTTRGDVMRALSGGANGYINKPFEFDSLLNAINAVLGLQLR